VTKKDYQLIADTLRIEKTQTRHIEERFGISAAIFALADTFEQQNERFNRKKFLEAAGEEYFG
jgi:hypothetical protein